MKITPLNYPNISIGPKYLRKNILFKAKSVAVPSDTMVLEENNSLLNPELLRQKIIKKRLSLLKPIKAEEEYKAIVDKIGSYLLYDYTKSGNAPDLFEMDTITDTLGIKELLLEDLEYVNFEGYENIDFNLKGLVPYCGFGDISRQINSWLTARKDDNPTLLSDEQMADIIRAFDYSLNMLDKKYGKFKGLVYRAGCFNPICDKQYYSASDFLSCAIEHTYRLPPSEDLPYSIIRLKRGHDIHSFQKDTATSVSLAFAQAEREILMDRKSKFRLVPRKEYTREERAQIRNLIYCTLDKDINELSINEKNEALKNIFVWEEI